jgi:parallel beta-helix repeat protein
MRKIITLTVLTIFLFTFITTSFNVEHCNALAANQTVFVDNNNTNGPWDGTIDDPYSTIQEGINAANYEKKTVYVLEGVYNEDIVVNKTINLIGQKKPKTIISGTGTGHTVHVTKNNVNITGFTIKNSGEGFSDSGIRIASKYVNISNNNITGNHYGIYVNSDYNMIYGNTIISNWKGIRIPRNENVITKNSIKNNTVGVYFCCSSTKNLVYYNNFYNSNGRNGDDNNNDNRWCNYSSKLGNYWEDYNGLDKNGDGIGDTAYIVDPSSDRNDSYPLMQPVNIFEKSSSVVDNHENNNESQNKTNEVNNSTPKNEADRFLLPGFEMIILIISIAALIIVKKRV